MHNTWFTDEYWEDTKGKVNEKKERKNTLLTRGGGGRGRGKPL